MELSNVYFAPTALTALAASVALEAEADACVLLVLAELAAAVALEAAAVALEEPALALEAAAVAEFAEAVAEAAPLAA